MSAALRRWTVTDKDSGKRLDIFLTEKIPAHSRTALQRSVRDGDVRVNAAVAEEPSRKLRAGDEVAVNTLPATEPSFLVPEPRSLKIIFEDDALLVIDKPAGLTVHPGSGQKQGTLANALAHYLGEAAAQPGWPNPERPGIVHRLDKGTSGLIVVAKTPQAHRQVGDQFSRRDVRKIYQTLIHGRPPATGTFDRPIGRDRRRRTRMAVSAAGRPALTSYRVVEQLRRLALARVQLHTGRTHQIRVHFAHAGHPVVGDPTYSQRRFQLLEQQVFGALQRPFLHAAELQLQHPVSGQTLRFSSPLPEDLEQILETARRD